VWRWDQQEPFGDAAPNEDPDGNSVTFSFPVRFAGQYADSEALLSYNKRRNYNPSDGRYVESDPVGLRGGLNTYLYVDARPLSNIDPLGLTCHCGNSVANFAGGAGGQYGLGPVFVSADSGVAFDTEGNVCLYSMICGMAPPMGVIVGGGLGLAGSGGGGRLCTGQSTCVGITRMGGAGILGEGQVLKCGSSLTFGRGLLLAGEVAGGGVIGCKLTLMCFHDSKCCSGD